jgi:hypothetical protein
MALSADRPAPSPVQKAAFRFRSATSAMFSIIAATHDIDCKSLSPEFIPLSGRTRSLLALDQRNAAYNCTQNVVAPRIMNVRYNGATQDSREEDDQARIPPKFFRRMDEGPVEDRHHN